MNQRVCSWPARNRFFKKQNMKTKFAILLFIIGLIGLAVPAQAQTWASETFISNWTNAATLNSNITSRSIIVNKQKDVTLQIRTVFSAAGATNVSYSLYRSQDNTTFETVPWAVITVAGNGTTPVVTVTNLTVGGAGYLRVGITNGHTAATLTNTILYGIKISAP